MAVRCLRRCGAFWTRNLQRLEELVWTTWAVPCRVSPSRWRNHQPCRYLWKDASGQVIYVGKAKNLRARMRQYVTLQDYRQKIPLMMQLVASFDYIVVDNEHRGAGVSSETSSAIPPSH